MSDVCFAPKLCNLLLLELYYGRSWQWPIIWWSGIKQGQGIGDPEVVILRLANQPHTSQLFVCSKLPQWIHWDACNRCWRLWRCRFHVGWVTVSIFTQNLWDPITMVTHMEAAADVESVKESVTQTWPE